MGPPPTVGGSQASLSLGFICKQERGQVCVQASDMIRDVPVRVIWHWCVGWARVGAKLKSSDVGGGRIRLAEFYSKGTGRLQGKQEG